MCRRLRNAAGFLFLERALVLAPEQLGEVDGIDQERRETAVAGRAGNDGAREREQKPRRLDEHQQRHQLGGRILHRHDAGVGKLDHEDRILFVARVRAHGEHDLIDVGTEAARLHVGRKVDLGCLALVLALTRPDNPYLFPQLRLRRAGDVGDGHLSERLLNSALADLQKPGRALHAVQQFNTHSFRGWFTTHMARLGFKKSDTKLILDHRENRQHDTTDKHYDWEQSLPEKFAILSAWENLITGNAQSGSIHIDAQRQPTTQNYNA